MTQDNHVRVLLIDKEEESCASTRQMLREATQKTFSLDWSREYDSALRTIKKHIHDVYLLDYQLGERTGLDLLREALYDGCTAPMIMLTRQADQAFEMEALQAGAADSLVKDQINATLLERSIRYAIERKRADERMAFLAHYDPLTGLANRSLFKEILELTLAKAQRNGTHVALLFLDLDRFKVINDSLGHDGGDQVLKIVGQRLRDRMRKSDVIARLGGDEFTVILDDIGTAQDAAQVAQELLQIIAHPLTVNDQELFITPSIGIAVFPQYGDNPNTLIKNADMAMYRAKRQGRNTFRFFTTGTNGKAPQHLAFDSGLRHALEREELLLQYQPQVEAHTGQIIGIEALLRWQHPEQGLIHPDDFIPLAEENGLIVPIGEWVLKTACRQNKAWQDAGLPPTTIGVNLSARQFRQKSFVARVQHILEETGLDPQFLELELTETLLFESNGASTQRLSELKSLGIQISIDDFGTGYSSLSYLKCFPISTLKIDRSFVRDIPHNPDDTAIASGMIALAHSLRVRVTAEGVESPDQLKFLQGCGCDAIQGHLVSPPLFLQDIQPWLATHRGTWLPPVLRNKIAPASHPETGQPAKRT